jgi:uncharacterized protein YfaS (alpha-2-macroglobulin family)
VTVRAGLPAADGEVLQKTDELDMYVRDRARSVRVLSGGYVLPKGGEATIPIVSVNSDTIEATVYRVGDRALAGTIGDGKFLRQLSGYDADTIKDQSGEQVWKGTVAVTSALNQDVTTAIPVGAIVPKLKPGAYVMVAKPASGKTWDYQARATQWFIVTDIGLTTLAGNDGFHVIARSLSTAGPVVGAALRLVAVNNEVLATGRTDAQGYARFDPGLVRGTGGLAPALIVAEGSGGDYSFLDLTKTAFDLSDRGITGRPSPKPLDVFLAVERGVYRPGETAHAVTLIRDTKAMAIASPMTLILKRPDGMEAARYQLADQKLGGGTVAIPIPKTAMRGTWRLGAYADPKGESLAETTYLVEDFQPERLTFDLKTEARSLDPAAPAPVALDARFLYGAPAANLAIEGETVVKPADGLDAFPGYRFGLADESFDPVTQPLPEGLKTDAAGHAAIVPALGAVGSTSKPLQATVIVRVLDSGGQPVERTLSLPVKGAAARVGAKPLFDGAVEEGGNAAFDVVLVGPDGKPAAGALDWSLEKVLRTFQWYQSNGGWNYEPVVSAQRVANGSVAASADGAARVEAKVDWGEYRLTVTPHDGAALPVSVDFDAGWYVAPKTADAPDILKVTLDKQRYKIGDTATVRIEPRFAGTALVMVMDDRLVAMQAVEVPATGASVRLPVTRDWGPGAYVTATLFRPMSVADKRMPGRAIGLSWAGVDPGDRKLAVALAAPEQAAPRQPLGVDIKVAGAGVGEEAYVTLAAVDLGILNLTRYAPPAPDHWYFGQRRLGMDIRDLYSELIDRFQGMPGHVKSGGDGGQLTRLEGPPPTETLVSFFSGPVKLDGNGSAHVDFAMPDFNGTVRLMAVAWTSTGIGHAVRDVVVRDPIVTAADLPRFLAPGDRSRLLLHLTHVEGPAGAVQVAVATDGPVTVEGGAAPRTVTLADKGEAELRLPIKAETVGDAHLTVTVTTPDGKALTKHLTLGVRDNEPTTAIARVVPLAPDQGALTVTRAAFDPFKPHTGIATVAVSGAGPLDVPGILHDLDRYPYGCSEQLTSRALPLLYLDQVALAAGLSGDETVRERVQKAIADVLANQGTNGDFGLWGPSDGSGNADPWLDAYIADFLTRAREVGYAVPDVGFDTALDNLKNRVAMAPDFDKGGEGIAYALYVLARNGKAAIGDLRYYADIKLAAFTSPLAKAQVGAALALYGDLPRAESVMGQAVAALDETRPDRGWRADYGSTLRDGAAILTLASETKAPGVDAGALAGRVAKLRLDARYTSTQDDAWTLLAAHALIARSGAPSLRVDGAPLSGPLFRTVKADDLPADGLVVANGGTQAIDAVLRLSGIPVTPPPAGGDGYTIERAYFDLKGKPADPAKVEQGARLAVVLTVTSTETRAARLIVDDPLPAGFEIDNPNLLRAGDVAALGTIRIPVTVAHTEFRSDRFVAALSRGTGDPTSFQLAYIVRAVSPGHFLHPAATVMDMYRPDQRARTATGTVDVAGPLE